MLFLIPQTTVGIIEKNLAFDEKMTFQSPENGRIVTVTAPLPEDMLCLMTPDR